MFDNNKNDLFLHYVLFNVILMVLNLYVICVMKYTIWPLATM